MMNEEGTAQTPIKDLIQDALDDYERVSTEAHHWNSLIPKAIKAYGEQEQAKEDIIKEAGITACKILVATFRTCGLESHIEQMFIDEKTGEEYVLQFYAKKGFKLVKPPQK